MYRIIKQPFSIIIIIYDRKVLIKKKYSIYYERLRVSHNFIIAHNLWNIQTEFNRLRTTILWRNIKRRFHISDVSPSYLSQALWLILDRNKYVTIQTRFIQVYQFCIEQWSVMFQRWVRLFFTVYCFMTSCNLKVSIT